MTEERDDLRKQSDNLRNESIKLIMDANRLMAELTPEVRDEVHRLIIRSEELMVESLRVFKRAGSRE